MPGNTTVVTCAGSEKATTKTTLIIAMLERPDGGSIAQIVELTGWQSHSARAAPTGLRKRGLEISKRSYEGQTSYHIGRPEQ